MAQMTHEEALALRGQWFEDAPRGNFFPIGCGVLFYGWEKFSSLGVRWCVNLRNKLVLDIPEELTKAQVAELSLWMADAIQSGAGSYRVLQASDGIQLEAFID